MEELFDRSRCIYLCIRMYRMCYKSFGMTTKILIYIILFLLMLLSISGFTIHQISEDRDNYKDKVTLILAQSKESKRKYDERVKSYEYARDEVAKYYNEAIEAIEEFKKGDNETYCEAANRLFDNAQY